MTIKDNNLPKACAYCGSEANITNDHVPPKNIFSGPRPNDLITIPACERCNRDASKDEEYFRLKLCMSQQLGNNVDANKIRETIFRSLNRSEASGLKSRFLSDSYPIKLTTSSGIHLPGKHFAYYVDLQRIFRVVEKTARGLFFHETNSRLHPSYEVAVLSNETLIDHPTELIEEWTQTIIIPLAKQSPKIIGNNVFAYRFKITEEDPFVSAWALTYYDNVAFLCLTGPRKNNQPNEEIHR